MGRIRLVLSDMDGTVVPFGSRTVTKRTHDAIRLLRAAGIAFGPSSGRERVDLLHAFFDDERCVETGIMGNGKLLYLNDELVLRRPLPKDQLRALVAAIEPLRGVVFQCYLPLDEHGRGKEGMATVGASPEDIDLITAEYGKGFTRRVQSTLPHGDITTGAVLMARVATNQDEVYEIIRSECPRLEFPIPSPYVFDIVEKGWSKLSALPTLLDHLGIGINEVAYLGDSQNDITMMEAIPHSFCMGDGSEDAKAAARWVVDTCANNGAAKVMESIARTGGDIDLLERYWADACNTRSDLCHRNR